MLFFRSEEQVREWCREQGRPLGPRVTIDQLWGLATAWYANRLSPDSRRPGPEEIRRIFAGLGLDDDFWRVAGKGEGPRPFNPASEQGECPPLATPPSEDS